MNRPIRNTLGPYRLNGKIGEGGMGVVFRAEDPRLHCQVAIKVLPIGARRNFLNVPFWDG